MRDDDRVIQEVNQTIKGNQRAGDGQPQSSPICCTARATTIAPSPYYDRALKLQPGNAEALNGRCGALAMVGELKAALEDCNE